MNAMADIHCDLLIMGGGLSGCLIALALAKHCPALDVRLIEAKETLGGNHVWSFFESDVDQANRWLVAPLIVQRWASHEVRFPTYRRVIDQPYCSITSVRLDAVVRATLMPERIIHDQVEEVTHHSDAQPGVGAPCLVLLRGGRTVAATQIIDARGAGDLGTLSLGYQKFVGQMLHVAEGHGLNGPIIMDATVDQAEGYRFVYCLPFSATDVFVEDTYYTNDAALDVAAITQRIAAYAAAQGWEAVPTGHLETGIVPVVCGGDFEAYVASTGDDSPKVGVRAGLFHALTGYSLPDAVRLACDMPSLITAHGLSFSSVLKQRARAHWRQNSYFRMLATMLFHAAAPAERYRIFERFYKLSPLLIARFYAGRSTYRDKLRVLIGRPPVPLLRAVRVLLLGYEK